MYDWDETKRQSNLEKHRLDFADMESFDWDTAVFFAPEFVDGEQRETVLGLIDLTLVAATYTERGEKTRIISLRRATKPETRIWKNEQ